MTKGIAKFAQGMGIGLAVGCAAGWLTDRCLCDGKKGLKKTIGKACKSVSGLMEDIGEMF